MGGISGLFGGSGNKPQVMEIGESMERTLNAQTEIMPRVMQYERHYAPQMTNLGFLKSIQPYRGGSPEAAEMQRAVGQMGDFAQGAMQKYAPGYAQTVRQSNPELYKTLGMATGQYEDLLQDSRASRGPTSIEQKIYDQGLSDLEKGRDYTDREARDVEQSSRAAYGARGRATDNAGIAADIMARFGLGSQLEQQRRGFAMGANQMMRQGQEQDRAYGLDVGRFGLGVGQLGGMAKINPLNAPGLQQAMQYNLPTMMGMSQQVQQAAQPSFFNPLDPTGTSINVGNRQQQMQYETAKGANKANMISGLMGMGGSLLAAPLTGGTSLFGMGASKLGGMFGGGASAPINAGFNMGSGAGRGVGFGM